MASIKGSRTECNLLQSFAGESQARNRYTFFASAARNEGLMQISAVFAETADQEKEHAERFFKFLEGGSVNINAAFPAGVISSTTANLIAAAEGEYDEWHNLYPEFAEIAKSEGFTAIASASEAICVAERQHERRFRGFLHNLETESVFKKEQSVVWRCRNCGYLHTGPEAPAVCFSCAHPQGYFELLAENW